ncbi:hypothetical protein V6N12_057860 [Hibiscus sabdariffa]
MLSSSSGCSKRARVGQLEDTMISNGVDDVKDTNDKLGCNSTKFNLPDKTQMSRQKNSFSGKRGERKNFKVPMKPKFDSFSKKAGFASFTMASGGNNFLGMSLLQNTGHVQHPTVMQKVAGQLLSSSLSRDVQGYDGSFMRHALYQRRFAYGNYSNAAMVLSPL